MSRVKEQLAAEQDATPPTTHEIRAAVSEAIRTTVATWPSLPPVPCVYRVIAMVAGELAKVGISKDRRNQQQGFAFRGIDDVQNVLAPLLAEHGLVILPRVVERECVERQTKSGGALFYVCLKVEYDLIAVEDGSKHTAVTYGEAMDSADKATNKSLSAAYKYMVLQSFCVPTQGNEDADATTPEPVQARVKAGLLVIEALRADLKAAGIEPTLVAGHYNVDTIELLTAAEVADARARIAEHVKKREEVRKRDEAAARAAAEKGATPA